MGLLNHIFRNTKEVAGQIALDDEKRVALWNEHLANYSRRAELAKPFAQGKVDDSLKDFDAVKIKLDEIGMLISPELVNIENEEKTDQEIVKDLETLKSVQEIERLASLIMSAEGKQKAMVELFKEILNVLKTELHLIKLARKNPANEKELLGQLAKLVNENETHLYKVFWEQPGARNSDELHKEIVKITRAILVEEEIRDELVADEQAFVNELVKKMSPSGGKNDYRELAEDIFLGLTEMAGSPLGKGEDGLGTIGKMKELMRSDEKMEGLVKKLRPAYDESKVKCVVAAFREAYRLGNLIDFEGKLSPKEEFHIEDA